MKYTYDIAATFPGGKANTSRLAIEIALSGITVALERIDGSGGTVENGVRTGGSVDVVFKAAITEADILAVIAAHNNSLSAVDVLPVSIQEESPEAETGGYYGSETVEFTAATSTVTTHDIVLPIPISLLSAHMDAKGKNDGDRVGFDMNPLTTVGALAEGVAQNATTIPLPASVMALFAAGVLFVGMHLILDADDCGIVTSVDQGALTVSVKNGPATAKVATDAIKVTASMSPGVLQDGWVKIAAGDNKVYDFGDDKIGGSYLPSGSTIRIRYENSGAEVPVSVNLNYLY